MPALRGRLTSSVTPSAVPAAIIGTRRRHPERRAVFGLSKRTLTAQQGWARERGGRCEEGGVVELGSGELRHVELVVIRVDHEESAAFRRERLPTVADLDHQALVVRRQREVRACGSDYPRIELDDAHMRALEIAVEEL